ncbi:N-methylhydantoinase [Mycolicibacterium tokaiense]|uniref:N-methylhydantoinase n=1 Tax=Mycolicibacterium tokaiense TaxID=39695 RepID=A0A378TGS6_9MYCO|nr:N-methylhydantoinase [Mycolicibacterium tokaiense]
MNTTIRNAATFEVFRNAVSGLADELAITILRTAHSQIVASSMDFSAALCDAQGRIIAQANTCPVHLGSIPDAIKAVFEEFGEAFGDGDVYLLNDPDRGGMHLPDIFAIAPVFTGPGGRLIGFVVTVVNHADVGGWAAGSMAVQSTNIFAEGVQIPPSRMIEASVVNQTFYDVILRNVREPELLRGDLDSQLAACHAGSNGIRALVQRYGIEEYDRLVDELLNYSELLVRNAIAKAPDGEYRFRDAIDDDGLGSGPIPFEVTVTIRGSDIAFDFTGSSPRSRPHSTPPHHSPDPRATPPCRERWDPTSRPIRGSTDPSPSPSRRRRFSTPVVLPPGAPVGWSPIASSTPCWAHSLRPSPNAFPPPATAVRTGWHSASPNPMAPRWSAGTFSVVPGERPPPVTATTPSALSARIWPTPLSRSSNKPGICASTAMATSPIPVGQAYFEVGCPPSVT